MVEISALMEKAKVVKEDGPKEKRIVEEKTPDTPVEPVKTKSRKKPPAKRGNGRAKNSASTNNLDQPNRDSLVPKQLKISPDYKLRFEILSRQFGYRTEAEFFCAMIDHWEKTKT